MNALGKFLYYYRNYYPSGKMIGIFKLIEVVMIVDDIYLYSHFTVQENFLGNATLHAYIGSLGKSVPIFKVNSP